MDFINAIWSNGVAFVFVLSVLVFVHELGHYLVARSAGVRVDVFSIGFGKEIYGWTDKVGTRWKISWIPLGGYVKFFGDADEASSKSDDLDKMTPEERAECFQHKPLGSRMAVVVAGPLANFAFAVLVMAVLFASFGRPFTPPVVGETVPGSAAEEAGFLPGDRFVSINGDIIERFEDIQQFVMTNAGTAMQVGVERNSNQLILSVTPRSKKMTDRFGNEQNIGFLGIQRSGMEFVEMDILPSIGYAFIETGVIIKGTLKAVGEMIAGSRGLEEMGGPVMIAKISGDVAEDGIVPLLRLMAILSISLGLINLFPIPMLDGGHLLFYIIEGLRGRPLGDRIQEYGMRMGMALVLTLMVVVTWNDLRSLQVVKFVTGLFS